MSNASFSELDITSIKDKLRRKKYDIKHVVKNNSQIEKLFLQDVRNCRLLVGKLATRLSEGETYYWPCLHHRNLERLLDIVNVNSKETIYITHYMETTLRDLIHQESFFKNPMCYLRKKSYIKDVLWGLEYLHANSLVLLNLCDSNVLICEKANRAVISDFSALTIVEKAKKQAFSVQPFHQAPELSTKSFKKFDPKAAEMWTAGVMILEIILQHKIPWKLVDFAPCRVVEVVDGLELPVLEAANPKSPLTTRDLEELKRLTNWLFCEDPSNRCSALSAAVSEFIQSSRNVMTSRKALPLDRELSARSTKNDKPDSSENEETTKSSGDVCPFSNEGRSSENEETESQITSEEQFLHTCGKNKDVKGNCVHLKTKSASVVPQKQLAFPFDSQSYSYSLPGLKSFGVQGENLQDFQKEANSSSQGDSQGGKQSGSDESFENSQDEVNEESSAPFTNSIDPSEIVQIPIFRGSFESYTKVKQKSFKDLNKGTKEYKTPSNSRRNSSEVNASPINKNLYNRRSKSCSLLPGCGDHHLFTPENSFRSHSYYICSSSANLSSYLSENSTDLISLILSIKRRLEFIDALLFGPGNFPCIYDTQSDARQRSRNKMKNGEKNEAKSNGLKGFDNSAFDGNLSAMRNFNTAELSEEPIATMNDQRNGYQKLIKNKNLSTKTPEQKETSELKTVTRQTKLYKKNRVQEEIKCETFMESTKTLGDSLRNYPESKGSTQSGIGELPTSHSKISSMSKIQEALLCKRQYSYQKAVWGKGKMNPDMSLLQYPEKPTENRETPQTRKIKIGKGFIEVEVGSKKKTNSLAKKEKCKKRKNIAPGDCSTHPPEVPDVSPHLHVQKKKKKFGCFCLRWKA